MDNYISSLFQKITRQEYLNKNIQEELKKYDYELISSIGVDRLVFAKNKNSVIKVARNENKIDINYDEAAFWNQHKNKNLFCPVIDNGPHYTWIKMKYCNKSPKEFKLYKQKVENSSYHINDLHPDNIGRINKSGELVCFDYPNAIKI